MKDLDKISKLLPDEKNKTEINFFLSETQNYLDLQINKILYKLYILDDKTYEKLKKVEQTLDSETRRFETNILGAFKNLETQLEKIIYQNLLPHLEKAIGAIDVLKSKLEIEQSKKWGYFIMLLLSLIILIGTSFVSYKTYSETITTLNNLENNNKELKEKISTLQKELEELKKEIQSLKEYKNTSSKEQKAIIITPPSS